MKALFLLFFLLPPPSVAKPTADMSLWLADGFAAALGDPRAAATAVAGFEEIAPAFPGHRPGEVVDKLVHLLGDSNPGEVREPYRISRRQFCLSHAAMARLSVCA